MLDPKLINGEVLVDDHLSGGNLIFTTAKGTKKTVSLSAPVVKADGQTCGFADTPNSFCLNSAKLVSGVVLIEVIREHGNTEQLTFDLTLDKGEFKDGGSATRLKSSTNVVAVATDPDADTPTKVTVVVTGQSRTRNATLAL